MRGANFSPILCPGFGPKSGSIVQDIGQARWSIPKGVVTAYKVTKITDFGLIYVSIVQGIGQARWSIPKGVAFGKVVCDACLYCIRIPHLVNVEVGSTPSNVS